MLIDTDVLIWHLRGYPSATHRLDLLPVFTLSVITYLVLIQGMRDKIELVAVQKMLSFRNANVLLLAAKIGARAATLMELLSLSRGLQLGDALIAATALDHQLPLLTENSRHFAPIAGLRIESFGSPNR